MAGGKDNQALGLNSLVGGGHTIHAGNRSRRSRRPINSAAGGESFAAGFRAKANHSQHLRLGRRHERRLLVNRERSVPRSGGRRGEDRARRYVFIAGANPALQAENNQTTGEGGWFRVGNATNPTPVVSLVKQSTGTGFFLKCFDQSGTTFTGKCHISAAGTFVSGSDFAESLPARGGKAHYEPGDVLSISRTHAGRC